MRDPFFGDVLQVQTSFSFNGNRNSNGDCDFLKSNIRTKAACDPLGALGDLAWYNIRLGIIAFNKGFDQSESGPNMVPIMCTANCYNWTEDGVPLDAYGRVVFGPRDTKSGRKSDSQPFKPVKALIFESSFLLPFRQTFEICGSMVAQSAGSRVADKVLTCDDFVLPRRAAPAPSYFTMESSPSSGPLDDYDSRCLPIKEQIPNPTFPLPNDEPRDQEARLFFECARLAQMSSNPNPSDNTKQALKNQLIYWQDMALLTQGIVDACFKSMQSNQGVGGLPVDIDTSFLVDRH